MKIPTDKIEAIVEKGVNLSKITTNKGFHVKEKQILENTNEDRLVHKKKEVKKNE